MKPIVLLDLTKCAADEIAALRRDGFNVPPNIAGYRTWPNPAEMAELRQFYRDHQ